MATEKQNKWVQGRTTPRNYVPLGYGGSDPMDTHTINRLPTEWQIAEKALLASVLESADNDIKTGKERFWSLDAMIWFIETLEKHQDHIFSFVHICEIMGFDPGKIRAQQIAIWIGFHAYEPTVDILRERQKAYAQNHAFVATGHYVMCDRREEKRKYRREHPAPPRPHRKRILGFSRKDHRKLD